MLHVQEQKRAANRKLNKALSGSLKLFNMSGKRGSGKLPSFKDGAGGAPPVSST